MKAYHFHCTCQPWPRGTPWSRCPRPQPLAGFGAKTKKIHASSIRLNKAKAVVLIAKGLPRSRIGLGVQEMRLRPPCPAGPPQQSPSACPRGAVLCAGLKGGLGRIWVGRGGREEALVHGSLGEETGTDPKEIVLCS